MVRSRIIPCLLIHQGALVKTTRFADPRYIGDPLNAVRIFNEKQVDELIVLDIDAGFHKREPDYELIQLLSRECRMPLCYGGGICRPDQVEKIISLGVEKVALGRSAVTEPGFIEEASRRVGSQSIVVVMDVRKSMTVNNDYELYIDNGSIPVKWHPVEFAKNVQLQGAGEILINSIDRDGTFLGYDLELIDSVRDAVNIPITALGGAGSHLDLMNLVNRYGIIGAAAGSLFVFKGKYRAVLIQYPVSHEKEKITLGGSTPL
jgi:cyclase